MRRKLCLLLFSSLLLPLLLSACAPAPTGGTSESAASNNTEKIQITMWLDTDETADCVVKTAVDSFNAKSDTIEVIADRKANMIDAVRPALAGGAGPDLVPTHGPAFVA